MAVRQAPELAMPVTAPVATVFVRLRMILLLIFSVSNTAELDIPVIAPVPVLAAEMILLPDRSSIAAPPVLIIPLYTEAAVPEAEQF